MSRELNRQQSLAAVSLSDLIDSALLLYGIPSTAVKRITGLRQTVTLAPFFARELHPDSAAGAHLLLIGDAAMRVEFWPGKGVNTALVTAHAAAMCLLSSITGIASKPYFELTPAHLQAFSRQMAEVADHFDASCGANLLPVPAASSRWTAVAAMPAEDVVHELMDQICDRGATAVEHLWPILPSHTLIETRLRQMIPGKVHVLRRMLRDGSWPGEGAKVMAPLSLPPLPSPQTQSVPVLPCNNRPDLPEPSAKLMTVPAPQLSKAPNSTASCHDNTSAAAPVARHGNIPQATPLSRQVDVAPATPLSRQERAESHPQSTCHCTVRMMHSPTISSAAPARMSPSQQTDLEPIKAPRKQVSMDAASDQSASGQSSHSGSITHSVGSARIVNTQTMSDIEAKIAVLTKWGQPLPPSPELLRPESSSRHAKGPTSWLRPRKHDAPQSERLSVSISHVDSVPQQQLATQTQVGGNPHMRSETMAAAHAAAQNVSKQEASVGSQTLSHSVSQSSSTPRSVPSQPRSSSQESPRFPHHPQQALPLSLGQTLQLQPTPVSSRYSPSLTHSSPQMSHQPSQQGSQECQGQRQAESNPQAQSPVQHWPHVRKYAVPQPLKAGPLPPPVQGSDPPFLRPPTRERHPQRQSSDRDSGLADPARQASSLLRSASLSQMLNNPPAESQHPVDSPIQPQTPLPSQTHRRAHSQPASQQPTVVAAQPEARIKAGNVEDNQLPDWAEQGRSGRVGTAGDNHIWQTPQLPSKWCGQGNLHGTS